MQAIAQIARVGTTSNETISGLDDADTLFGAGGNDTINGRLGDDQLFGGAGADTIYAGAGNDVLAGGTGNDTLAGDTGNDTFHFAKGWGVDVVTDAGYGTGNNADVIQFSDVASTEILFERNNDALVLKRGTTGDVLTLNGFYTYSGPNPTGQIEQFRFTNTTLDVAAVTSGRITYGTTASDSISAYYLPSGQTMYLRDGNDSGQGSQFNDTIYGEGGDDYIYAYAGNDTVDGGTGNDTVYGDEGNDTLTVGLGNDYVAAGNGDDVVLGGDGNDTIYAGAGNDVLTGGTGNDTLAGDTGNDTFHFAKGWGVDVVTDAGYGAGNNADVIQFSDVASTEILFERNNDALVLKRGTTGDVLTLNGFYTYSGPNPTGQIEQFRFTNTTLDVAAVTSGRITYGTTASDSISAYYLPSGQTMYLRDGNDSGQGSQFNDTIYGEGGDDYIYAYAGNDTVDGGTGNDTVYGDEGNDTLTVGLGNDYVAAGNGDDVVLGGDGNDTIYAGAGNDVLTGGTGNDTLAGDTGNDTFHFAKGWGVDVVTDAGYGAGNNADVIQFSDVASTEILFERNNDALVLKRGTTGDVLTLNGFYTYSGPNPTGQIEQFRFTNTTLDVAAVTSGRITYGTTASDSISAYYLPSGQTMYLRDGNDSGQGSQFNDTIYGEGGDDYIYAYAGNDTVDGGTGNDTVYGDEGNDTLTVGLGNDYVAAGNGDDVVLGGDGNDTIYAGAGNDVLTGGTGNDTLAGDTGNDTFHFAKGWGVDVVTDAGYGAGNNADVIQFSDVASTEILFERNNDALVLKRGTTGDVLTLNGFYTYSGPNPTGQIEQFRFTNTTLDVAAVTSGRITYGTTASDSISAYYLPSGQTMYLRDGNDSGQGSQFNDTIYGEGGDDYIYAYAGNDTVDGGTGNDTVYGDEGNDTLTVGLGNDYVAAGNGDDVVLGGDGNDIIYAGAGNDVLTGGTGNDTLAGDTGNDTFHFAKGWGVDVVTDAGYGAGNNADVIQFSDVASTEILFERNNDALVLKRGTTGDVLTLNGFYTYSGPNPTGQIEQFRFTNTTLDVAAVTSGRITYGTTASDSISAYYLPSGQTMYLRDGNDSGQGSQFNDTIYGEGGDDYIYAYAGNDTVDGGTGNDTVYGDEGNDTLTVGLGNDYVAAGNGDDVVLGGDGNDTIYAGAGNDVLTGGTGNDTLAGDTGNDTFHFAKGWGVDVVTDAGYGAGNNADVIQFSDVASTEILFERNNDALVLKRGTTGDVLTLNGFYTYSGPNPTGQIEQFRFTNTTLDVAAVTSGRITYGTTASDSISAYYLPSGQTMYLRDGNDSGQGSQFNDTIYGEGGDDYIYAYAGNDTVDGGTGNDTVYGDLGDDSLTGREGADSLYGGSGFDVLSYSESSAPVTVNIAARTATGGNATGDIFSDIEGIIGSSYADTLTGDAGANLLNGGGGADTLFGGAGNDTLTDAAGANVLVGGAGNDTLNLTSTSVDRIAMARGHGSDVVNSSGTAANDVLEVSNGITKSAMGLIKTGNDLIIDLGASETVTLKNWYATTSVRHVGTLKIIGDAAWVPGQTGTPTQVETLNMASLVTAFDAWRAANPTLTRWPLDSFSGSASMLRTASISDVHDELVGPISTATASEAYVHPNLKSLMKFYALDPEPVGASDLVRGAPRTIASVLADEPVTEWARIQPVARTAPWWEESDIADVVPAFNATSKPGNHALSWQRVHSELALQLGQGESANESAPLPSPAAADFGRMSTDAPWATALSGDDTQRVVGRLGQKVGW